MENWINTQDKLSELRVRTEEILQFVSRREPSHVFLSQAGEAVLSLIQQIQSRYADMEKQLLSLSKKQ